MRSSRRQPQGRVNAPKDWGSRGLALFIKDGCRRAGGALRRCPGQQIRLRRAASALAVRTGRPVAEGPLREPSTDNAWFSHVAFPGDADFEDANFTGDAGFGNVTFTGNARFSSAAFTGNAWFSDTTFTHDADFDHLAFARDAQFSGARFERAPFLGPLNCGPLLNLSEAIFSVPVTIQVAAEEVRCVRTRWDATVSLRLRYAKVDLSDAVVTQPTAVTTHPHSLPEHACLGLHRRANGEDDLLARDRHGALGPDGYRPQQLRLHRSVPPRPAPPRRPYPIRLRTDGHHSARPAAHEVHPATHPRGRTPLARHPNPDDQLGSQGHPPALAPKPYDLAARGTAAAQDNQPGLFRAHHHATGGR